MAIFVSPTLWGGVLGLFEQRSVEAIAAHAVASIALPERCGSNERFDAC